MLKDSNKPTVLAVGTVQYVSALIEQLLVCALCCCCSEACSATGNPQFMGCLLLPQYQDIVVSVARKTDAAMWPALFLAVGVPSELLDSLVNAGALASAACCLLIVDRIEGSATAHSSALRLIKVGLALEARKHCRIAL